MYKTITFIFMFSSILFADLHNGKELFQEQNCLKCHSTDNFKPRKDKVNNLSTLTNKVSACSYNTDTGWFDDEVKDVSSYLNKNYYNFKEKE